MSGCSDGRNGPAPAGPDNGHVPERRKRMRAARMSRRNAIGVGLGAVAGAGFASRARAITTPLRAVVTIGGQSYEHREDTGRDLGDFVSTIGGFTQRCIRGDATGSPLTVYFRPDATSDRAEVVFEHCNAFAQVPANIDTYTVAIYRGADLLASVAVPAHYQFSRWRWQSAPRPVVANIDQLIAQGLLPPYDRSAVTSATPPPSTPAPAPVPSPVPPSTPQPTAPAPDPTTAAPPPVEAHAVNPSSSPPALPSNPFAALTQYLQSIGLSALASAHFWALSSGDRRPGLLEKAAIGTAIGALAAKAFQMSHASGAELPIQDTVAVDPAYAYTPMGLAGVTPYMPQTGERNDIGLLTEHQARYVCTEAADALAITMAQAEASGTVPWHMRDETTNAPLDFRTYPRATWYWDSRVGDPWVATTATPITPDSAHMPGLSFLPYLLTGDPYHLEELQFVSTWVWGAAPPASRPGIGQSRAFAWFMRTLAHTARMTPASVPSWLLPQSYWVGLLQQNRSFLEAAYVNGALPQCVVFRSTGDLDDGRDETPTAPGGTWVDPWQEEFETAVFGWIVSMGFTDWQTAFNWKIGSTLARTGTTSGWVRAHATPYRMILRPERTAPTVQTWADAWTLTQQFQGFGAVADPNTWADSDMTYLTYSRGALVYAAKLGTQLGDNLSWATGQLKTRGWSTPYKWRLGNGLV